MRLLNSVPTCRESPALPYSSIAPQAIAVLAELANQLDIPQIAFDVGGYARFQVDEHLELLFAADAGGLTLSADLGLLPTGSHLAQRALEANFWRSAAGETWLGLEPERHHLHLFRRLPAAGLDYLLLETSLCGLLEDCAVWQAALHAPAAAPDPSEAASSYLHILGFDRA